MTDLTVPDLVPLFYTWLRLRNAGVYYGRLREQLADFLKQEGWSGRPVVADRGFHQSISAMEEIIRTQARKKAEMTRAKKQKQVKRQEERGRQGTLPLIEKRKIQTTEAAPE